MNWYLSLARGKQIVLAVFLTHAFLLAMLGADHWMHRNQRERKKVNVHTFVIAAPPKPVAKTAAIPPAVPRETKAQTAPPAKKVSPKPEPKKSPAKALPPAALPSPPMQDTLLSEIEKNLDSLAMNTPPAKKSNIDIPNFHSQSQLPIIDYSAAEQIAALLQETLELPEFGEVKIKLSINRFGVLEKLEILEAKSQKNGEFLKKRLPEVQFPCLNELTTLTIVFSNAR